MLFGRDTEMGALRRLCRSAAAGAGGSALVEGVAGAGKTALMRALTEQADGLTIYWGRVPEEGDAPAYWPWREIAAAAGWDIDWTAWSDPWALRAEVAAVITDASRRSPLLLLVDDLHAADDDTHRLTAYLARALADAAVALVVASRPDQRLDLLTRSCDSVSLGPLADDDADHLLDIHGGPSLPAVWRAQILEVAEGNPLVLRELARSAARGTGGGELPREVRRAVEQRLAPLAPDERALVDRAAVLGRRFTVADLAALTGRAETDVLAALDHLRALGIATGEGPRWAFTHQVVREAVHDGLPSAARQAAHRDAAAVVAAGGSGASTRIARHLLAAVPTVPASAAIAAARRAADEARHVAAHGERAALLERALAVADDDVTRLELLLDVGAAHLDAGTVDRAVESFDQADELSAALGDEQSRARALLGRAERVGTGIAATLLLPGLVGVLPAVRAVSNRPLLVRLLARIATMRVERGDIERADRDAAEAATLAREDGDPTLLAIALNAIHVCCWAAGREAEAAEVSRALMDASAASGDLDRVLEAAIGRMVDALRLGDLTALDDALEAAAAVAARSRSPRHQFFVLSRSAMRAMVAGHLAEALSLLRRAGEIAEQIQEPDGMQVLWGAQFLDLADLQAPEDLIAFADEVGQAAPYEPRLTVVEAVLRMAAGQVTEASTLLRVFLDAGIPTPVGPDLAWGAMMAIVAVGSADPVLAGEVEALLAPHAGRLVVNSGAVTFCGSIDHWLGALAAVQGRHVEAATLLTRALSRYETMPAPRLAHKVRTELARLALMAPGVPERDTAAGVAAVLRPVGSGWEVGWADHTIVVPDSRGLHHLHTLLRDRGHEIHVADLINPGASAIARGQARQALLDDTAKDAYRRRIRALKEEVAIAGDRGQFERATRAQAELDTLLDELRRAVGLSGRGRPMADDTERARMAVRKAISAALTRLAEHDAELAAHLRAAVRTGVRCSYEPDPVVQVTWVLA